MAKLKYTLKTDTLFKMMFVKHPGLLKQLVSELLRIPPGSIGQFDVLNPEIPPNFVHEKHCRLDIHMTVDGLRVGLEVQVRDEGDYPERSLYYWAREYSSTLPSGDRYIHLPRTVFVHIVNFKMFKCKDFYSEFRPLEVTRHELLTDRMSMHYFELKKIPKTLGAGDGRLIRWLALFKANTEEDLEKIEALGDPIMNQAISAYRSVSASAEFQEMERLRDKARIDGFSALRHAEQKGIIKGEHKGRMEGRLEGERKGKQEGRLERELEVARSLKNSGVPIHIIADSTGLPPDRILRL
jgi:predicted transposase/invertase (TIGR01784 family)